MELNIGMSASISKTISESDILNFADLVGDYNSVHLDEEKVKESIFGRRIANGVLVGSLISSVIGTKLPGDGTIYLEQNLKFQRPIYISDTITALVTVNEILNEKKGIYRLDTVVMNQNEEVVINGYAIVKKQTHYFEKEV